MLHASNPTKNWTSPLFESLDNGNKHFEAFCQRGYQKSALKKDGFVFADDSLQFKFYIKKNNYMQRLEVAEDELKAARLEIEELKSQVENLTFENVKIKK